MRHANMAAFLLAIASGHLVAAGRSLLQDAPTGMIMCDVAIVGGGPGEDKHGSTYAACRALIRNCVASLSVSCRGNLHEQTV